MAAASPNIIRIGIAIKMQQPIPIRTLVGSLGGVTAITRQWEGDDHRICRLCPRKQCTATDTGVCLVITEEAVTKGGAPLYSSHGLDHSSWVDSPADESARSTLPERGRLAAR